MTVDLGDVYKLSYDHYVNGALATAGAATWTITLPDGTTETPFTATTTGTGLYRNDYATVQAGRHVARWEGTGANAGAYVESFNVAPAAAQGLFSLAAAKAVLNITPTVTTHDEELRTYIEAVTAVIEGPDGLNKPVVRRTEVEQRTLHRPAWQLALRQTPVISLTSVVDVEGATTYAVADLHLDKETGVVHVLDGSWLAGHLTVTYVAGYTVIPGNIVKAAELVLQDAWSSQRGSRGSPRFAGQDPRFVPAGEGELGPAPVLSGRARQLLAASPIPGIA